MSGLSWKTEDENESPALVVKKEPTPRRFHRLIILLSLVIAMMVTFVVYGQLRNRSARNESQVEIDVRSAFKTWRDAVLEVDTEILRSIVVADDARWLSTQRQIIENEMMLDRRAFGLLLHDDYMIPEEPRYELSDDWRSVTFFFTGNYTTQPQQANREEIDLLMAVDFRREGSRWLYGQPVESFWGDSITDEFRHIEVTYPERDREIVHHLATDLDNEIDHLCSRELGTSCPSEMRIKLILEHDPSILFEYLEPKSIAFKGQSYYLPSPTLIGIPVDDGGYRSLYDFYSETIVGAYSSELGTPIALPDQNLQILCYDDFSRMPKLFTHEPDNGSWETALSDQSFGFLSALANDEGLMLQELPAESGLTQLRLLTWVSGFDQFLLDYQSNLYQAFPAGPSTLANQPNLLFRTVSSQPENIQFTMLAGSECLDIGCEIKELDGFPTWSPDGRQTILWQGGFLAIGDSTAETVLELGEGFTAFWFDQEHFGYAHFKEESGVPEVVILVATSGDDQPDELLSSHELVKAAGLEMETPLFIQYAAIHQAFPEILLIMARDYVGDASRFYLFKVGLAKSNGEFLAENIDLVQSFRGKLSRTPSAATPTGRAPFTISPDGSLVTVSRQNESEKYWEIHVFNLIDGRSWQYQSRYPSSTFTNPYYDWSSDGQWLVIVDDGFLRLVAPLYDYQRFIRHDYPSCGHVAWVNN